MRQICPACLKPVDVPDAAAGTDVPCPACGKVLAVPRTYTPAVQEPSADRPAPPPGLVPPAPPAASLPAHAPVLSTSKSCGITFGPGWLGWLPLACLLTCLVLTFFAWVGAYPGGVRILSQSMWDSLVGGLSAYVPSDELQKLEVEVAKLVPTNWLMWPYFAALVAGTFLACAERVFREAPTVLGVPAVLGWLPGVWPHRFLLLSAVTALLLALLVFQSWRGFGLEVAVKRIASEKYKDELAAAEVEPKTETKSNIVRVKIGQESSKFNVDHTTALKACLGLHALAFVGSLGGWWLSRRGSKAPPRLVLEY